MIATPWRVRSLEAHLAELVGLRAPDVLRLRSTRIMADSASYRACMGLWRFFEEKARAYGIPAGDVYELALAPLRQAWLEEQDGQAFIALHQEGLARLIGP